MTYAKLFRNGRSQAVRLPREFRFPGERVRVRRIGSGVLLEPVVDDVSDWFAAMDRLNDGPFMPEGREQPPTPEHEIDFVSYLLDTSTCNSLIEDRPARARRMLADARATQATIAVLTVAVFELWFGVAGSASPAPSPCASAS